MKEVKTEFIAVLPVRIVASIFVIAGIVGTAVFLLIRNWAEGGETVENRPSLSVQLDQDKLGRNLGEVGGVYVFPDAYPADIPPPPEFAAQSCSGRYQWASDQQAVVAGSQRLRVSIGLGDLKSLTITGYRLVLEEADEPLRGIKTDCSGGGGPPQRLLTIAAELSSEGVDDEILGERDFYFDVADQDTAAFDVVAEADGCDCQYYLLVSTIEDGVERERRIDDDGAPFRVTSLENTLGVAWDVQTSAWVPTTAVTATPQTTEPLAGKVSTCRRYRDEVSDLLPQEADFDGRLSSFRPLFDVRGSGLQSGLVSLCSWSYGEPDSTGSSSSVTLQDLRLNSVKEARQTYRYLRQQQAGDWRSMGDRNIEFNNDRAVALLQDRRRVVFVGLADARAQLTAPAIMRSALIGAEKE